MIESSKKVFKIYKYQIIIGVLFIVLCILLYMYFTNENASKFGILAGGAAASLFVALIQYLFSFDEYRVISSIRVLDIKQILPTRDEEAFYRNLIERSKNLIRVMGVTASRMMEDFADESSGRSEKKVLLSALSRGVRVQILLPQKNSLPSKEHVRFETSIGYFGKIKAKYENFEVRYFDHIAAQSIFMVDKACILGPVFTHLASKDTPCIFMGSENEFARKYIEYFDSEWNKSNE